MMNADKHKHSLYEIEMQIIALEFKARSRGLDKKQEGEQEVLKKRKVLLEDKIRKP
ncbi:MAG: hypothetical protein KA053_01375 [Lentimicrobiaceae bacterium]|nr:hypothetical protein [Lentimicrobiaceae bacterium]